MIDQEDENMYQLIAECGTACSKPYCICAGMHRNGGQPPLSPIANKWQPSSP